MQQNRWSWKVCYTLWTIEDRSISWTLVEFVSQFLIRSIVNNLNIIIVWIPILDPSVIIVSTEILRFLYRNFFGCRIEIDNIIIEEIKSENPVISLFGIGLDFDNALTWLSSLNKVVGWNLISIVVDLELNSWNIIKLIRSTCEVRQTTGWVLNVCYRNANILGNHVFDQIKICHWNQIESCTSVEKHICVIICHNFSSQSSSWVWNISITKFNLPILWISKKWVSIEPSNICVSKINCWSGWSNIDGKWWLINSVGEQLGIWVLWIWC